MKFRLILSAFLIIAAAVSTAWSAPATVYVAEFSVSGTSKPEEMKTTIQSLLLSRLATEKLTTVAKQPDFPGIKVSGSYLLSGAFFSLDAVATDASGTVISRAYAQGKSPDELIPAVGTLAKSISESIEKSASVAASRTLPAIAAATAPAAAAVTVSAASTVAAQAAPTAPAIPAPAPSATAIPQGFAAPADVIVPIRAVNDKGGSVFKLEGTQNGVALGRTLPGGERELFVVGSHTLRYYRQGSGLKLIAEVPYKNFENVLAVDTADLDGDAVPEIYVTVMSGETLVSQVWAVNGDRLKQLAGPLPY